MNNLKNYKEYCNNLKIKECRIENLESYVEYLKRYERLISQL